MFHDPIGAFRRKADYKYEKKCENSKRIKHHNELGSYGSDRQYN